MLKIKKFSNKTKTELKSYVYVLTTKEDETETIFYIGKGTGDRVFSHFDIKDKVNLDTLSDTILTDKQNAILNNECNAYIVDAGLTAKQALSREALLINVLRVLPKAALTNIVNGHHKFGVERVENIDFKYAAAIDLQEYCEKNKIKILTLKSDLESYTNCIHKDFRGVLEGIWSLDKNKLNETNYVLGIRAGSIYGVYKLIEGTVEVVGEKYTTQEKWDWWNQTHINMGRPEKYALVMDKEVNDSIRNKVVMKLAPVAIPQTQNVVVSLTLSQKDKKIGKDLLNRTINDKKISGRTSKNYFGIFEAK